MQVNGHLLPKLLVALIKRDCWADKQIPETWLQQIVGLPVIHVELYGLQAIQGETKNDIGLYNHGHGDIYGLGSSLKEKRTILPHLIDVDHSVAIGGNPHEEALILDYRHAPSVSFWFFGNSGGDGKNRGG